MIIFATGLEQQILENQVVFNVSLKTLLDNLLG
jgi:hypothetical protein